MAKKEPGGKKRKRRSADHQKPRREAYCSFCRKSYYDVGPFVEGPNDVYICGECVELCQSIVDQERRRQGSCPSLHPFGMIRDALHQLITGQGEAQDFLTAAVHSHYECMRQSPDMPAGVSPAGTNILLIGPSLGSKIFLVRCLAALVGASFAIEDASPPAGVTLGNSRQMPLFYELLRASDFDIDSAGRGMVYFDGADRRDTQQAVLSLIERRETNGAVSVLPPELDQVNQMLEAAGVLNPPDGRRKAAPAIQINTASILFLCGGAFPGLDKVIARRGRHPEQPLTADDLIAYGMLPDLARRFSVIVPVAPLDEETLVRIATRADLGKLLFG